MKSQNIKEYINKKAKEIKRLGFPEPRRNRYDNSLYSSESVEEIEKQYALIWNENLGCYLQKSKTKYV